MDKCHYCQEKNETELMNIVYDATYGQILICDKCIRHYMEDFYEHHPAN